MNTRLCTIVVLAAALAFLVPAPAARSFSPPRASVAPVIQLKDLSGAAVSTAKLAPRTLVLIFGELDHDGVRQACADVLDVLATPRVAATSAVPILIIAKDVPSAQLKDEAAQGRFPPIILHDPQREAFGAYRVLVIPTVVVVDGSGKVVHAMPGFLQRSKDVLADAILAAAGKVTPEQFEHAIDPAAQTASHDSVRADRLTHLGAELARHGLLDMAQARYTEATTLVPGHVGASLGLGELMLRLDRPNDAEPLFRSILGAHPDSLDAALGLAAVQVRRGGDDLTKAEATLKSILAKDSDSPRAHFLLGRIFEHRADLAGATAEYRTAAEILLDR